MYQLILEIFVCLSGRTHGVWWQQALQSQRVEIEQSRVWSLEKGLAAEFAAAR